MPSHIQIARVLDGGLDAAIAWAPAPDGFLDLRLLWAEPLAAVVPARIRDEPIAADRLDVLALRESTEHLTYDAHLPTLRDQATWVPAQDPHGEAIRAVVGSGLRRGGG